MLLARKVNKLFIRQSLTVSSQKSDVNTERLFSQTKCSNSSALGNTRPPHQSAFQHEDVYCPRRVYGMIIEIVRWILAQLRTGP